MSTTPATPVMPDRSPALRAARGRSSRYRQLLLILGLVYAGMTGLSAIDTAGEPLRPTHWRLQQPRFLIQQGPNGGWAFNSYNQQKILEQAAINLTLGVGMTFVILTAGIDLSVGSILAVANVLFLVTALAAREHGHGIYAAVALGGSAAVLAGMLCGAFNGCLCTWLRVPSFIVTLGTLLVLRGVAYWISGGETKLLAAPKDSAAPFLGLTPDQLLTVGVPIGVSVFCVAAATVFLGTTGLGRRIYAVGGNWLASRYAGVRTGAVRVFVFACSGACAGLAGVIYWSRTSTGSYTAGEGAELYAIAAVVLGGTRLAGGEGTIPGTFLGALIMSVLANGLNSAGVHELTQKIIVGSVLVAAAAIDSRRSKLSTTTYIA